MVLSSSIPCFPVSVQSCWNHIPEVRADCNMLCSQILTIYREANPAKLSVVCDQNQRETPARESG